MKKSIPILKQLFRYYSFVLIVFIIFSLFNIKISKETANIFYTVAGIFFSIGISQIMSFDFSRIADEEKYKEMKKSLKTIRDSYLTHFGITSILNLAVNVFPITKEDKIVHELYSLTIMKKNFELRNFLSLTIVFSIGFFIYNYVQLSNKKQAIEDCLRTEK